MNKNSIERAMYRQAITVPPEAIDANGHLNNVTYVQWMQDIAIAHANHISCTAETAKVNATWIARSHTIEYLRPAFEGEQIVVLTWIESIRKVQSLRKYRFYRQSDQTLLVTGETNWVFISRLTGKPQAIPSAVVDVCQIIPDNKRLNLQHMLSL